MTAARIGAVSGGIRGGRWEILGGAGWARRRGVVEGDGGGNRHGVGRLRRAKLHARRPPEHKTRREGGAGGRCRRRGGVSFLIQGERAAAGLEGDGEGVIEGGADDGRNTDEGRDGVRDWQKTERQYSF